MARPIGERRVEVLDFDESDYYEDGHGIDGNVPNHTNVEEHIYHQRHGNKTAKGELAPSGIVQAIESGLARELNGATHVMVNGSEIERTKVTGRFAAAGMAESAEKKKQSLKVGRAKTKEGMSFTPFSKAGVAKFQEVAKGGEDPAKWYWQNHMETGFDEGTISGKEMAERTAHDIYREIEMAGRLNDGSKIAIENASHTLPIEVFLMEAMGDEIEKDPVNPEGTDAYDRMGGSFGPADDYEIVAKTDENGRLTATMHLRGKEYRVNLRKLSEMSERYLEREKQKRETAVETPA